MVPSVLHSLLVLAATLSSVTAHPAHDHDDVVNAALPGDWYHPEDHPVHALFKRGDDGVNYAAVGTPEWSAGFPNQDPMPVDGANLPKAWVDALNAAVKAGKIPDIPVSTNPDQTFPKYPSGFDPNGPTVCSATYKCRNKEDIWDAPDGVFASSFDDGPLPDSIPLYNFLKQNNVVATHFMIGINILYNPDAFKTAYEDIQSEFYDIAVHTWTHPYMTTLNNLQLLGEFGWTMQIIHNSTGGRLPKYWRPPFGDSDERVRALAKEVFGLTTVIWNQDTEDWSVGTKGGSTIDQVNADLEKWISGAKSPGLIILEHELNNNTVGAFMKAFPLIAQNGWQFESLARLNNAQIYQNAADNTGDVTPMSVGNGAAPGSTTSAGSTTSGSSTPATGSTTQPTSKSGSTTTSAPSTTGTGTGGSSATTGNNGAMSFASSSSLVSLVAVAVAAFALS
ncbi:hypothetical protein C8Q80DRAFT_1306961 [Daedaleopsis nitida]|nr:hypothetical protein C8Q80DRAFT_1306961 [Daedaleopsis nitida]